MNRARRLVLCLGAAPLIGALLSCASDPAQGYSFKSTRPEGIHTVAVPVFGNTTYEHGLEIQLTDAIIKEIQRRTPWVVTSSDRAQTTLSGSITRANLQSISTSSSTGLVQEVGFELTANFEWKDATGKVLAARKDFRALETFVPERGTNERLELGQHAAVQELATSIVNELRSAW